MERGLGRGRFFQERWRRGLEREDRDSRAWRGRAWEGFDRDRSPWRRGEGDQDRVHHVRGVFSRNRKDYPNNSRLRRHNTNERHYNPKTPSTHVNPGRGILGPKPSPPEPSIHLPPPFKKSFSSLFSNLPLVSPNQDDLLGWTKVVSRRSLSRARKARDPKAPQLIRRCFFCGDQKHLAKDCKVGGFVCFRCNGVGHKANDCPAAIKAIPTIALPEDIKAQIDFLSSCALFYVCKGNPTLAEIKEMMDFKFNIKGWPHKVSKAAGNSFLVQFPDDEMIDQAEDMKLVDMGDFKGRFLRWREDLGFKCLPDPFLTWVNLDHLPYHLWDWEFLQLLFRDIGECIACSDDVAFHSHYRNCKVLIKVHDLSLIPKEVRFRCNSPLDNSLMEGYAILKVIGKKIKVSDFINKVEVRDHVLKWEGEESSSSGWADRGSDEVVLQPPLTVNVDKVQIPSEDVGKKKGKKVTTYFTNSKEMANQELSKEKSVPPNQQEIQFSYPPKVMAQSHAINADLDLIQVLWNGNEITVDRDQWDSFWRIQGVGGSSAPGQHIALNQQISSDTSSKSSPDSAQAGSNSVSLPPGFEKFAKDSKKKKIGGARLLAKPLSAKKFRTHLAASRSKNSSVKKSKVSSTSASVSLPLNEKSNDEVVQLAVNCGIKEPISLQGVADLKALEMERSKEIL